LSAWFGPIERDGQSISRYLGHYTYGRRVIMHYEIGGTRFLENISRMKNGCFVRMVSALEKESLYFLLNWMATKIGRSKQMEI
jgi:hypothetical protein